MPLTGLSLQRNVKHLTQRAFSAVGVLCCLGYRQRQGAQEALVHGHGGRARLQAPRGPPHHAIRRPGGLGRGLPHLHHLLEAHFALLPALGRRARRAAQDPLPDGPLPHVVGIALRRAVPGVLIEQALQALELSVLQIQKGNTAKSAQAGVSTACPFKDDSSMKNKKMEYKMDIFSHCKIFGPRQRQLTACLHSVMHVLSTLLREEGSQPSRSSLPGGGDKEGAGKVFTVNGLLKTSAALKQTDVCFKLGSREME